MAATWRIRDMYVASEATELRVSSRKEKSDRWAGLCTVDLEPRWTVPVFFQCISLNLFVLHFLLVTNEFCFEQNLAHNSNTI